MAIGTLNQKIRPIRIAFLVTPSDKKTIQKAIHINSLLWGGMYNPLIPCYKSLPKSWSERKTKNETAVKVIKGYIDAFDPDFFINFSGYSSSKLGIDKEKIVSSDDIIKSFKIDHAPTISTGVCEIADQFIYDEMRFIRKTPVRFINPVFSGRHDLFLSSIYGDTGEISELFHKNYLDPSDVNEEEINISNYLDFLSNEYMFSRRVGAQYLEQRTRGPVLFFMDATKPIDVIDYWNLRAAGWSAYPIAKQSATEKTVNNLSIDIIENSFQPYRYNDKMYHHASFIKSRSTSEEDLSNFAQSLAIKNAPKGKGPKYTFQHWYPRIWNEWARKNSGEHVNPVFSETKEIELKDGENEIRFKAISPKFDIFNVNSSEPRYAVEIDSKVYGHEELLADVIPLGGENLSRAIAKYSIREWRISKTGPVYLPHHRGWGISYEVPFAEPVMTAWFKDLGWEIALSPSGKIAKQMISQLGGPSGIMYLKHEKLIKLFSELNSKGFINENLFKGKVSEIVNEEDVWINRDEFIKRLLDKKIFQLGIQLKCPVCSQQSWYSPDTFSGIVQCTSCLNEYNIQTIALDEKKWAYKAFGTFGLPKQAYGSYSVLLTLDFLMEDHHERVTPILSFDGKKGTKSIEADLCLLSEKDFVDETHQEIIFAECKTYNKFEKTDIDRMKTLGNEFPGSALVFSTLRTQLTEKEKRLLKPMVNNGRKNWKSEKPSNPIIILTGTELFSNQGIPYCWKDKPGKAGELSTGNFWVKNLTDLADATQQIYLDMKPYLQWQEEQYKKWASIGTRAS